MFGHIPPRDASALSVQNAIDHTPIIDTLHARGLFGSNFLMKFHSKSLMSERVMLFSCLSCLLFFQKCIKNKENVNKFMSTLPTKLGQSRLRNIYYEKKLMYFVQIVLNFDKMSRQINHDLQDADGV